MGLGQPLFSLALTSKACCGSTVHGRSLSGGGAESPLPSRHCEVGAVDRSNLVGEDGIAIAPAWPALRTRALGAGRILRENLEQSEG